MSQDNSKLAAAPDRDGPSAPIAFGPFRLLLAERRLERNGKKVQIGGRALDILIALAAEPGSVVSKAQLRQAAWPGMVVEEANLRFHIGELRKVLDKDSVGESFIATAPGRGYCLTTQAGRQSGVQISRAPATRSGPNRALVGREAEDAELSRLLDRTMAGEAQVAFVTGEAGVGKSALVARFVQEAAAAGAGVVIGWCLPGSAETDPYYPILDILSRMAASDGSEEFAAMVRRIAPAWAIQLPTIAEDVTAGGWRDVLGATRHRMARELCSLLDAEAKQRTLVLVLEDIQWADLATLDIIRALANHRLKTKLMIVATLRYLSRAPAASSRSARQLCESLSIYHLATEIPLTALTSENVAEYVTRRTGLRPAPELSVHLHARSGGNPLFMQAMLEHWLQKGLVTPNQEGWALAGAADIGELETPPTLARLIDGEIEQLEPDRQRVVHAASVSEGVFSAAVNHAATPLDEAGFEEVCEDLTRTAALIGRAEALSLPGARRVQGYAFRHKILRDVAYERQSASQLSAAHAAVAAEIEGLYRHDPAPVASALARHFLEAEDWVAAVKYLRLAARVALGRFSPREAAAALEQALAAARNFPPAARAEIEVEIKEELAPIYGGSLDPRAPALFAQLVSEAARVGRVDIQCWALIGQAVTAGWSDLSRSVEPFGQALALSEQLTDAAERARIRTHAHGWCSWGAGWDSAHAAGCEAAVEELRQLGEPVALAEGLANYAKVLLSSARYLEAYDMIASSVEVLATSARDSRADLSLPSWHMRLGMPWCLLFAGRLGQSFELSRTGVKALLADAEFGRATTLQFYQALGHILAQDFEAAADLIDEAVGFGAGASVLTPNEKQIEMAVRGLTALGRGDPVGALDCLERAGVEVGRTLSTWYWRMVIEWAMTDACLAAGRIDAARVHADELRDLAWRTQERTWRALACETAARIALADGDVAGADMRLREGWEETQFGPLPQAEWRLHAVEAAVRGAVGDVDGAARHRQAGAEALAALAQTLPEGHSARATLKAAKPLFAS